MGGTDAGDAAPDAAVVLPSEARTRVVALAAQRLGALADDQVPWALARFSRFTPAKRARLAAGPLATALEQDAVFRQQVGEHARELFGELAEAVVAGSPPPAAPPEDVAAVAYLLRPQGWTTVVDRAAAQLAAQGRAAAGAATVDAVARLTEQLEAVRAAGRATAEQLRAQAQAAREDAAAARQEVAALRRRVRELGDRTARAERAVASPDAPEPRVAPAERPGLPDAQSAPGELRRLRARLQDAEAALAVARSATREGRHADELRLRLLLDTVVGAASGLRRELALPPATERPADAVAAQEAAPSVPGVAVQGRADDDPAVLDALLALPSAHLLVDGYNVSKTGYGEQTLEAQRARLIRGLAALVARTGVELTVVFDGVDHGTPLAAAAPRGVRLLFSRAGQTADDLLRRLIRAEPAGRPLVLVTSDRELADSVRGAARPVPSQALLRLLGR